MKKIYLVTREKIFKNAKTYETHTDDLSIYALDGIKRGPDRIISDDTDPLDLFEELEQEFKDLNPTFRADSYAIRLEDGSKIPC